MLLGCVSKCTLFDQYNVYKGTDPHHMTFIQRNIIMDDIMCTNRDRVVKMAPKESTIIPKVGSHTRLNVRRIYFAEHFTIESSFTYYMGDIVKDLVTIIHPLS